MQLQALSTQKVQTIYLLRRKQFVAHTQFIYYTESSWKNYCTHTLPVT